MTVNNSVSAQNFMASAVGPEFDAVHVESMAKWVGNESAVNYRSFPVFLDLNSQKIKFPEPNPTARRKVLFSATATEQLWSSQSSRSVAKDATQGEEVLATFSDLNSYVCRNPECILLCIIFVYSPVSLTQRR